MTVATCLALCAIIENAVVPELVGHHSGPAPSPSRRSPDDPRPGSPAGRLTKAVDRAVTKRLAAVARTVYGRNAPRPMVRVTRRDRHRDWAFGASVLPAPARSGTVPEAALFVAHRSGRTWSIGVGGTVRFRHLVERAPSAVLPADQRRALTRYADGYLPGAPSGSEGADTGLVLPWRLGHAWTFAGATAGTLAFSRGDGTVRAAGSGRLYRLCAHGLVMIVHRNGLATEYAQITDLPAIPDGGYVRQGAYLGHVGDAAPCRSAHAPARLGFALRNADSRLSVDGLRLGAWTLHARDDHAWATCAGHRVDTGGRLPNETEPPSPSPGTSASPVAKPHPSPSATPATGKPSAAKPSGTPAGDPPAGNAPAHPTPGVLR